MTAAPVSPDKQTRVELVGAHLPPSPASVAHVVSVDELKELRVVCPFCSAIDVHQWRWLVERDPGYRVASCDPSKAYLVPNPIESVPARQDQPDPGA